MKTIKLENNRLYMYGWMEKPEWLDFMKIPGTTYEKGRKIANSCPLFSIERLESFARLYDWKFDADTANIKGDNRWRIIYSSADGGGFYRGKLFGFQEIGIQEIYERLLIQDNVLLADEMGLGKTIQAIKVIEKLDPNNTLVVCPASLRLNWKSEIENWSEVTDIVIPDKKFITGKVTIINYAKLQKFAKDLDKIYFDFVIFDESHYLKSPKAKRTKFCFGAKKVVHGTKRLFMSGTPILNRPIEIFPLLRDCGIEKNWKRFTSIFCDPKEKYVWTSAGRKTVLDVSGSSNEEELQNILRSTIMIRRQKKAVLSQLPDKIQQIVFLPENGGIRNIKKERIEFAETLKNPSLALAISSLSEIRQENALKKIKFAKEYIDNILEQKEKVVIFAWHKCVIEALEEALTEYNPVLITGETKLIDRDKAVTEFQEGSARIMIGNIKAAGVGLTLTAASDVVFLEMDWTPGNNTQAEDRIHRIGQDEVCHIHYLVYSETVDAFIAKKVAEKAKTISKIIDKKNKKINKDIKEVSYE